MSARSIRPPEPRHRARASPRRLVLEGAPFTVVHVGVTRNIDQHAVGSDAAVDDLLTRASLSAPDLGSTCLLSEAERDRTSRSAGGAPHDVIRDVGDGR